MSAEASVFDSIQAGDADALNQSVRQEEERTKPG